MEEFRADIKEIKLELRRVTEVLVRNTCAVESQRDKMNHTDKRLDNAEGTLRWLVGLFFAVPVGMFLKAVLHA